MIGAPAKIGHQQWLHWSQAVAGEVAEPSRAKWRRSWVEYAELPEDVKEAGCIRARKVVTRLRQNKLIQ